MRHARLFVLGTCLVALACDKDPARSVKIIARPPAAVTYAAAPPVAAVQAPDSPAPRASETPVRLSGAAAANTPKGVASQPEAAAPAVATDWRPPGCPPSPETSSGPSSLAVAGPCAFEHRSAVACEALADDFLVTVSRKAADGVALMVFINVEHYKGPGDYTGAQMFVGVQDKKNIYRWSSDTVKITVGGGEESVALPATRLEAEPLLVNCTGPMTNFQCEGLGEAKAFEGTIEVVSGTLRCEKK